MNKVLLLCLVAVRMTAQDTIVFPKIDLYKRNIVEVSYVKPLGSLSDKYEGAVSTGFYMRTKLARRQFIDFGAELSGIIKGRAVDYEVNGEKIRVAGSRSSFLLGLRYTRLWYLSPNRHFQIETNSGLGWKYLHYSKPGDDRYKDMDFQPTLNTLAVTHGLKIMFHGFGVHCHYHYAPYGLFDAGAERHFGASSINFGLSGSWNF
ncbi:hypothetical protein HYN48_01275 [Flavobacterium magnum]|uniref:Outer membrane protein beta-barrel domain-containing protein n=1 Tax=Flavobacterium magnum TaxID=2162713 RepID=A0A2S0RB86_9FLAO|nr:hypothetical protein [Flavobacterium magnum]AWA28829.1 hypothetical protein HYN48_01275 [Flavobacterium magnum]